MRVIDAIVQSAGSQCVEKLRVVFERTSDCPPYYLRFRFDLRQFRNDVKRVCDSAALVVHNVVIDACRCPNQPFCRKGWICNGISGVLVLARFCELVAAKREDCGW